MIKVCYVVPGLDTGGAEKQLCELAAYIDRDRFDPVVLNLHSEHVSDWARTLSTRTIGLPYRGKGDLVKVFQIRRVIAAEKPDVLHCFLTSGNFYGLLASIPAGVPVRIAGERSIGTRLQGIRRAAYSRILPLADAIVTNSRRNQEWLAAAYPGARDRVTVIHNGCGVPAPLGAAEALNKRQVLGIGPDQFVIGSVTHLTPEKDVECLIRAAARLDRLGLNFKVLIAGEGPRRAAVTNLVAANALERRVWLGGHLPHSEALAVAQLSDVFVLTSKYEGMPNALMEAMAAGRACVASNVGGVPELIDGATTGLRFDAGNDDALAGCLMRLASDRPLRAALAEAGCRRVRTDFSIERMVRLHEDLYRSLLNARRLERRAS
jgi:glycosyltransferase involved in cell wall biosynthesis